MGGRVVAQEGHLDGLVGGLAPDVGAGDVGLVTLGVALTRDDHDHHSLARQRARRRRRDGRSEREAQADEDGAYCEPLHVAPPRGDRPSIGSDPLIEPGWTRVDATARSRDEVALRASGSVETRVGAGDPSHPSTRPRCGHAVKASPSMFDSTSLLSSEDMGTSDENGTYVPRTIIFDDLSQADLEAAVAETILQFEDGDVVEGTIVKID